VIHERARTLRRLGQNKAGEFRASQTGATLRALTLARTGYNWTEALTGNYLKVRISGKLPANEWHEVYVDANPEAVVPGPQMNASLGNEG